jgi:hypothetical protein
MAANEEMASSSHETSKRGSGSKKAMRASADKASEAKVKKVNAVKDTPAKSEAKSRESGGGRDTTVRVKAKVKKASTKAKAHKILADGSSSGVAGERDSRDKKRTMLEEPVEKKRRVFARPRQTVRCNRPAIFSPDELK